ncbi:MAG: hypothetical protein DI533_00945 [Cereibacter sphaeroides]|uniref:OmpR/PhoB-type domain-containing protein n=1 Tax=Cereibacter sphaeroides TaxID=1063 RepID=A0A2W5SBA7_CERSP|nr:MAG: hypothetical protein DI533_00945 [Cereibacter sphaeroides]
MEVYEFDGFVLDPLSGRLRNGQGDLQLRPKSLALLTHLLRNNGKVLGKEQLFGAIWPDVTVSDESLAQCVADIRRTLGGAADGLIRTVPGRGYMVEESRVRLAQSTGATKQSHPTITVRPFADLSPEGDHAWLAGAMTEELTIALSRIHEITVIEARRDLTTEALYALEGSVRAQGEQLRVTARIVDISSGNYLWSDKFDAPLTDVFAVQDEITRQVALSVQVRLGIGDSARLWDGQTRSLKAWERMVEARHHFLQFNRADMLQATTAAEAALVADPGYTGAMVQLGMCHWWHGRFDLLLEVEDCLARADAMVARARAVDPEIGITFMLEGGIAWLRQDHPRALSLCRMAVDRAPSDSHTVAFSGVVSNYAGYVDEGASLLRRAMRLSPQYPPWYGYHLALANLWSGQAENALRLMETYHDAVPDDPFGYAMLAYILSSAGDSPRAIRLISEAMARWTDFGIRNLNRSEPHAEAGRKQGLLNVLREAGLRE